MVVLVCNTLTSTLDNKEKYLSEEKEIVYILYLH